MSAYVPTKGGKGLYQIITKRHRVRLQGNHYGHKKGGCKGEREPRDLGEERTY